MLQVHKHSVDMHIFLAHCNGIQKNKNRVCNLRRALSHLASLTRTCRLVSFVTLTTETLMGEIKHGKALFVIILWRSSKDDVDFLKHRFCGTTPTFKITMFFFHTVA